MKNMIFGILTLALIQGCTGNVKKSAAEVKIYPPFDVKNMDTSVKPGDDFYSYAVGTWVKNNPIPADKNSKNVFDELFERNRTNIKEIIVDAAGSKDAVPGSNKQKIGTFYNTGMDTVKINEQGMKPLKIFFDKIEAIKTIDDVQMTSAFMQSYSISPLFFLFSNQDSKNSTNVIAQCYQAGIGLPERDYYFNNDESTKNIRKKYLEHLTKMFELMKDEPAAAEKNAQTVMAIETQLAKASFTNVENQDPQKTYNKFDIEGLKKVSQNIKWAAYFAQTGYPDLKEVNIYQPAFFKELGNMMNSVSVADWKTFLRWQLINSTASYLPRDFEKQNFDFYFTTLSGQEKMEPRWKLVLDVTSGSLGEAIGQLYVEKYFPPAAKERMTQLVMNLKTSLKQRIENLSWMGPQTKQEALAKLDKMGVKIGYPNKWRDYSGLVITSDSYAMNILNSQAFEFRFNMNKVGKPVDHEEWGMTPQTVNAGYYPNKNEIVFPAGILQPPFFNLDADDAINYGAIGMVIGHEMTHGFDNFGRQFDKDGNLRDWWTKDDSKLFEDRTAILVDQYNHIGVLDSVFVNGKLTLGENIADLGGATVAFNAYKLSLQGKEAPKSIDGFTDVQRFFLSYAQIWRTNMRDAELRKRVKTDEHSPAKVRINGVVYNMPEFYAAFPDVKAGDKLFRVPEQRPVIW
jgi:putative endopeptidase